MTADVVYWPSHRRQRDSGPTRTDTPSSVGEAAVGFRRYADTAEDDGNAMGIGDVVEQVFRQWAVHGSKYDIAVEHGSVAIAFLDPSPLGVDAEGCGTSVASESLRDRCRP